MEKRAVVVNVTALRRNGLIYRQLVVSHCRSLVTRIGVFLTLCTLLSKRLVGSGGHWPQQKLIRQEEPSVTAVVHLPGKPAAEHGLFLAVSGPCTHRKVCGRTLAVFSTPSEIESSMWVPNDLPTCPS